MRAMLDLLMVGGFITLGDTLGLNGARYIQLHSGRHFSIYPVIVYYYYFNTYRWLAVPRHIPHQTGQAA